MKHTIKTSIAYTIAAFAGTACLHAEDQPARTQDADATQELADTVVVANTYEVPVYEVGSTVEVITREDLEIGQTTFVLDALRELPGVYVRNNGGPGNSFGIATRGLNEPPVILIDGIKVSNPANGNTINPGLLFSNSVESIEFLKGPQSSLYGADALAGVININTREARDGETSGSVSAGYGSNHTRQATADFQTSQGAWDISMTANRLASDGFSSRDSDNEDDEYKNTSVSAKVGFQATETLELYAVGYYIDAESDYDNSTIDPRGWATDEQFFAKGGAKLQVIEQWHTEASFAFSNVQYESEGDPTYGPYEAEGDLYQTDWRNVITLNEKWTIAAGAEYEEQKQRTDDYDRNNASYYADNSLEVIENLFWTLGARYDDNSDYGSNDTWRTTVSYLIEPINSRLHGSYGTSFKAPTFTELYYPYGGNPNLSAEEGKGWDYGIEVSLLEDKVLLDATVFHNEIDDQIIYYDPDGYFGPTPGGFINNDSYESDGVEFTAKWEALNNLLLRANYTYTDAENDDGSDALRVPEQMANFSATWKTLEDKLDLKASIRYVDQRPDSGGVTVDDYTTVDLAGQYAISNTVTVWTALNNIFDEDYQEIAGYNSDGFNMMVGLRLNF